MEHAMEELQRAIGRLEGKADLILAANAKLDSEMTAHKGEDRQNFQAVASRFGLVYKKLEEQDEARAESFANVEKKLAIINGYVDNIKGAWWIVTILTVVVAGFGAAVAWFVGLVRH